MKDNDYLLFVRCLNDNIVLSATARIRIKKDKEPSIGYSLLSEYYHSTGVESEVLLTTDDIKEVFRSARLYTRAYKCNDLSVKDEKDCVALIEKFIEQDTQDLNEEKSSIVHG